MMQFLPVTMKEMQNRGISQPDFVYVCGDAYVDHPSFGMAIITRLLEHYGYSVGIIAQPDWKKKESVCVFGEPRLGFLVSAGNMDSMVNHYTVSKKHRREDSYSPGGKMGLRPDRAVIVYGNLIRQTYKHTPIIIGGIEASLRRLAHYDYWSDSLKRSVLLDFIGFGCRYSFLWNGRTQYLRNCRGTQSWRRYFHSASYCRNGVSYKRSTCGWNHPSFL